MENPFVVGGKYRNRKGEYEVIELDGPRMVIRYADGSEEETNVTLQARILANMQPPPPPPPPPGRRPRRAAARPSPHPSRPSLPACWIAISRTA